MYPDPHNVHLIHLASYSHNSRDAPGKRGMETRSVDRRFEYVDVFVRTTIQRNGERKEEKRLTKTSATKVGGRYRVGI